MSIHLRALRFVGRLTSAACAAAALAGALPARAGVLDGPAVDDRALQQVRGGFSDAAGQLVVSFGIQRAVYINGQLAADTGMRSGGGASSLSGSSAGAATLLVQQGAGNSVVSSLLNSPTSAATATLVQNSLSGQKIQTLTTIDVTANSLQAYRSTNLQSIVGAGIAASLRR